MARIQQLDPHVVNKIAAGEVIERPASVVKELLENSLDALATRIEVDIQAGGADLIRVADDGEGIHPDDFGLAFASHATSKIGSAEDLERVRTMGFRGEAIASIAAVSKFRLRSRIPDEDVGQEIEVNGGRAGAVSPCGCPPGTVVEVRQLFFNTPARRKFMKTTATEFGHISEQFTRVAIANPRLHAILRHNDKTVYELPPTDRLIDRLELFFGKSTAEQLIWVESETAAGRLWGYVGHPSQSKGSRKGQYLFLNGRWIQDRSLQHALGEAYRGLLMVGRYPLAFLFLEVPPEVVDVNVHPTKSEVRFSDSQQQYRQLLSTLRTKFLGMDLDSKMHLPGGRGQNSAAKLDTPPPPDPQRQFAMETELTEWAKGALATQIENHSQTSTDAEQETGAVRPEMGQTSVATFPSSTEAAPQGYQSAPHASQLSPQVEPENAELPPVPRRQRVMQVLDCYLVVESDAGLMVIDQHALHERVMYETLRKRVLDGAVESQKLLVPQPIELSPREAALVIDNEELLTQLGFGVQEFGKSTVLLTAYPAMLSRTEPGRLLRDIADQLDGAGKAPTRRDILDSLLHMMSCKAAIKAGQRLKPEEMESLLAQRHLIDDAHHCPHGRPTALILTRDELDRQFGRLG
ncbi:DNA mismatch repair endonuclease MutL [Thalassoroseus pseudoceratinae]|uniref:DNA mismatch repair endonuclease MutL n=1 Tax=Thalassoroseus pseudoceratinae TaxID=2713176 RepID=UPI001422CCAB|nr:DNA mismatch repair endonuclease MutL [Thalassoroseus pseudoceratinae]